MPAIEAGWTAPLGGPAAPCPPGGGERDAEHAGRHRHGPQCQTCTTGQWGEDRTAAVLPVPSFPLVFPVPHALNLRLLAPTRPRWTLLCNAASQTLGPCGRRHLGGQRGGPMGLQTWAQPLGAHGPVHGIMAAGALAAPGERWMEAAPRCLLPVRAWSPVCRGQCCAALRQGSPPAAAPRLAGRSPLGTPESSTQRRAQLDAKAGVGLRPGPPGRPGTRLGRCPPLDPSRRSGPPSAPRRAGRAGPLGRPAAAAGQAGPDEDARGGRMPRRCLWPGLPRGFRRLRQYGFLAPRPKARPLRRCRDLRGPPAAPPARRPKRVGQWRHEGTGIDLTPCPPWGARGPSSGSRGRPSRHPRRATASPGSPRALTRHHPGRGGAVRLRAG